MKKICSLLLALSLCTNICVAAHADQTVHFGQSDESEVVEDESTEGSELTESEIPEDSELSEESGSADVTLEDEGEVLPGAESDMGSVPEKVDPFTQIDLSGLDGSAMDSSSVQYATDSEVALLADGSTPSGSPVAGYYVAVTSSLGSGELFIPKDYAQGYFTFDGSGCLICNSNSTVYGLLVVGNAVYDVRFTSFGRPEYYSYTNSNYGSWVDFTITDAHGGNVQVMTTEVMDWLNDELFEACLLLLIGVIVCKAFMSR